jgi:hypothetical protein
VCGIDYWVSRTEIEGQFHLCVVRGGCVEAMASQRERGTIVQLIVRQSDEDRRGTFWGGGCDIQVDSKGTTFQ